MLIRDALSIPIRSDIPTYRHQPRYCFESPNTSNLIVPRNNSDGGNCSTIHLLENCILFASRNDKSNDKAKARCREYKKRAASLHYQRQKCILFLVFRLSDFLRFLHKVLNPKKLKNYFSNFLNLSQHSTYKSCCAICLGCFWARKDRYRLRLAVYYQLYGV